VKTEIAAIGYERRTLPDLIATLKAAGIRLLVDVRAVAASRRAGFSKTMLAATLRENGIDYLHLRPLGTPKVGRIAARAGRHNEMRRIFAEHLQEPAAQLALLELAEVAAPGHAALLCYEANPEHCHRKVLSDRLEETGRFRAVHL
jgi:uncharacterized protein (DUF488 family)